MTVFGPAHRRMRERLLQRQAEREQRAHDGRMARDHAWREGFLAGLRAGLGFAHSSDDEGNLKP